MDWFELYYRNTHRLPTEAQVSILLVLSWSRPVEAGNVVVDRLDAKEASVGFTGRIRAGLTLAVAAGWLAPIEELPDGSLRTSLRVPEGVAP